MGHLLFRLMTGTAPKKGADPPTSVLALVTTCPEGIAFAIESALQVDPQARPSAAQLAQELAEVLEAEEQEFARAMAKVTPAGRPPLRLVPAAPEAPADWTQHPIPDASSESALPADLAEAPPVGPTVANAPGRSRIAVVGAALVTLVAVNVTWWATHRPSDRLADVPSLHRVSPPRQDLTPFAAPCGTRPAPSSVRVSELGEVTTRTLVTRCHKILDHRSPVGRFPGGQTTANNLDPDLDRPHREICRTAGSTQSLGGCRRQRP